MKILRNKEKYDAKDRVIFEKFTDLRFHQHGSTGQMNFILPIGTNSPEVSPREFEDEKWLQEPSNFRLLNNYKFLNSDQKEEYLKK